MSTTPPAASSAELGYPVTGSESDPVTGRIDGPPPGRLETTGPELVRHEQRLNLSTRWATAETVRIRRRIITETRMVPVEVRVEVLEVEHLPLTSPHDEDPLTVPAPVDDLVFVLHEEVPVVAVRIRATERVTVAVRTVATTIDISEKLSSEMIDISTVPVPQIP